MKQSQNEPLEDSKGNEQEPLEDFLECENDDQDDSQELQLPNPTIAGNCSRLCSTTWRPSIPNSPTDSPEAFQDDFQDPQHEVK